MGGRKGYAAIAAGFVLAVVGFALIVYEVVIGGVLPLNDYTYVGGTILGVGIAVGAIGLDRGIEIKG
jgi:hypothetical protein